MHRRGRGSHRRALREPDAALGDDEAELRETIEKFREDELEHRDTAIAHEAEETPGEALAAVIKKGSKLAIWLSERV